MTPHSDSSARVLFIGHSGDLEAGLVSCLPNADHASWGPRFAPMDGAVLEFRDEPAGSAQRVSSVQADRLAPNKESACGMGS